MKIYNLWTSMRQRCNSKKALKYHCYGGRGIRVCDEWNNSFEPFCKWALSSGYSEGLTLDRKDNDKNYSPGNCKWSTREEQMSNRRKQFGSNTGIVGISKNKYGRYQVDKNKKFLGIYDTIDEAKTALDDYVA